MCSGMYYKRGNPNLGNLKKKKLQETTATCVCPSPSWRRYYSFIWSVGNASRVREGLSRFITLKCEQIPAERPRRKPYLFLPWNFHKKRGSSAHYLQTPKLFAIQICPLLRKPRIRRNTKNPWRIFCQQSGSMSCLV